MNNYNVLQNVLFIEGVEGENKEKVIQGLAVLCLAKITNEELKHLIERISSEDVS